MLATRNPFDEAEQLQKSVGTWITAGIETRMFWPKHLQTLSYDGRLFLLQPVLRDEHGESLPAIAIRTDTYGLSDIQANAAIMRLASALSWREGQKLEVVMWGGGNRPYRMGIARSHGITEVLSDENRCSSENDEALKALAYYREGLSLDNPFYAFLGFHKAFSRSLSDGKTRGPWIGATLPTLDDRVAI